MKPATYQKPGFAPVQVKNLAWLLRRAGQVQTLYFHYEPAKMCDGTFSALLSDGVMYSTGYASIAVCWRFVNRPSWRGLRFCVNGRTFIIGDAEFSQIAALEWKDMTAAIRAHI